MKKIALLLTLLLVLCACGGTTASSSTSVASSESSASAAAESTSGEAAESSSEATLTAEGEAMLEVFFQENFLTDGGWAADEFPQLEEPAADLPRVKLTTSMGDVTVVLYPSAAPLAVENFLTHCKDGYYDGLLFHRVLQDFVLQTGDPNGDGTGGESIYGDVFDNESCDNLRHFKGALAMANSGANTNGSQFYIVQADTTLTEEDFDTLMFYWYYNEVNSRVYSVDMSGYEEEDFNNLIDALNVVLTDAYENGVPEEYYNRYLPAAKAYLEHGGYAALDYGYTVFGQVIDGMDVVDSIAAVEVQENASGEKSSPVSPVTIVSTTVL